MAADEGNRGLDLGDDAHVAEQLFGAAEVFVNGIKQRQAAADVGIDVGFAMLDVGGIDELAVDEVPQHVFDIVAVGDDAEACGGIGGVLLRRGDLIGLDEADAERAVGERKEAEEGFAIAVAAADDLLLTSVPVVGADECVEFGLDGLREVVRRPRSVVSGTRRYSLHRTGRASGTLAQAQYEWPGPMMKLMRFSWPLMANSLVAAKRRHWLRMSRGTGKLGQWSAEERAPAAERRERIGVTAEREPAFAVVAEGSRGSMKSA